MSVSPNTRRPSAISTKTLLIPDMHLPGRDMSIISSEKASNAIDRFSSGDTLRSSRVHDRPTMNITASHASDTGDAGRAVMIDFSQKGQAHQKALPTVDILEHCLNESRGTFPCRRLYLLEGTLLEHANMLKDHFKIEPTFFRKHRRSSLRELDHFAKQAPLLPSLIDPRKSWCLKYPVLRSFEEQWESNWVWCAENGRKIELSRINGIMDKTGIVEQRASYWSQKTEDGGWNVIIAVDDSVKTVKIGGPEVDIKTRRPIRSKTYEGGYRNFVDNSSDQEPPLSSTFDDLCFFFQHHSEVLNLDDDPLACTIFLQKIIASNYMMLIKYVKSTLNHLSFRLSQRTNLNELDSIWVESGWSDLQVWTWRCNKYCQRVEAIMNSLGIEEPSRRDSNTLSATMSITTTCGKDFQGIHRQLMGLRERSDMLVSDFNSVAAIILNREALREANRSIQEAKSVRVLTLLGMVFLPLGLASSLLSMSDDYSPGEKNFWIYFAIAIPLVLFVVLVAGAVSFGYGGGRTWIARTHDKLQSKRRLRSAVSENV